MLTLGFESVAQSFLTQWEPRVPKGWTGSELKRWPVFLNNVLLLKALIKRVLDKRQH